MADSRLNEAERGVQLRFSKSLILAAFIVGMPTVLFQRWMKHHRPLMDLRAYDGPVYYKPVDLGAPDAPLTLAGAWAVESTDPRSGGYSALAWDKGRLLALSDSGMLAWLDLPGTAHPKIAIRALPTTAGQPLRKAGRDSEALLRDPRGQGWWVAFEQIHELIHYDNQFQALARYPVSRPYFTENKGVEALSVSPDRTKIVAYPEADGISDATILPDGREARLERGVGVRGFYARIAGLGPTLRLPIHGIDNAEGLAAAPLPNGGTRLWIITDNDDLVWRRSLLVAVDLPPPANRR